MDWNKVFDVLVTLSAMGVSALTGFMFALHRKIAIVETHMEDSIKDRDDLWGAVHSQRNRCENHRAESVALTVDIKYIKEKLSDISAEIKILAQAAQK